MHRKASTAITKVVKPSTAEAAALARLFPSSSSPQVPKGFDPNKESVFSGLKKRKKAARMKPSKVVLTLLNNDGIFTPRGKGKKVLEAKQRIKRVEFHREMNSEAVKDGIASAYSHLDDFNYKILSHSQDGRLLEAEDQHPPGNKLIENAAKHHGNVYLRLCPDAVSR